MAHIHTIENLSRIAVWETYIPMMMVELGIKVRIFRIPPNDMYHNVYGIAAGANEGERTAVEVGSVTAIIAGDDWTPTDIRNVGTLKEGWMYCRIPDMYGPGGNVTHFASNGGNGTRVTTSEPHGLSSGEKLFIYDAGTYNGFYIIFNASGNTFDILKTFTVDGTGRWSSTLIKEGDTIRFEDRQDTKIRRYKVDSLETIGSTIQIAQRFRISSLGD